jgi:hypothetical protein
MRYYSVFRVVALALCGAAVAAVAWAVPVDYRRDETTSRSYGAKIDGLGLDSNRWTGWISVSNVRSVAFDIDFTDANSSVTAVTMVCETSRLSSTANDAGRDLHTVSVSAGTITSSVAQWTYTTAGSKAWTWTVSNVPAPWLNCEFAATGTPAAADVITVYARGISP